VSLISLASCSKPEKNVVEKQIAVYETAIERVEAASNATELKAIREEVKGEIKAIKEAGAQELKEIRWNSFRKDSTAKVLTDSLLSTIRKYSAFCCEKAKQFRVK
jgi:hypothetical protein